MNAHSVWTTFYTPLMGTIVCIEKRYPRVCSQALNNSALIAAGVLRKQAAKELLVVLTT